MTTETEVRDALISYINIAWNDSYPTVPIYFENQTRPDLDQITEFLTCAVITRSSKQVELNGSTPLTRVFGSVHLAIGVREGTGSRSSALRRDFLFGLLKYKAIGGAQLQAPSASAVQLRTQTGFFSGASTASTVALRNGWYISEVMVPFYYHT